LGRLSNGTSSAARAGDGDGAAKEKRVGCSRPLQRSVSITFY
jgi:hypothetical protein